jgi:nucleoside-diphosphate-sugar epimerase
LENRLSLLVIGGTGFFGKSIIDSFLRGQLKKFGIERLLILSRNVNQFKIEFPELTSPLIDYIQADISTCDVLPFADIVIHAASSTDKSQYIRNGLVEMQNIELSVLNYCRLAPKYHHNSKIIYCSSGAVYGQQTAEFIEEEQSSEPLESLEDSKILYAQGKRFAEKQMEYLCAEYNMSVSIGRCFAFYGKYLPRKQHFAYGNFLGNAEMGLPITVEAKHSVIRSYMSADDLVKSLIVVALNSSNNCPIYNIGSDQAISIHDLALKIGGQFGVDVILPKQINKQFIDRYVPNTNKLKNLLFNYNEQ